MKLRHVEELHFFIFISPWLIGFLVFIVGAMGASLYFSFAKYDILTSAVFTGVTNYIEIFSNDRIFRKALRVSFTYSLVVVPAALVLGFALSLLMNQKVKGIYTFRTIFYLPAVVSGVGVALLWQWIFNPRYGILNQIISWFGVEGPGWHLDRHWALPALMIMSLWGVGGGMIIYLARLQGIPKELYEAAEVDGASLFGRFRHVTLPMMTPVIFFNLVMGIIGSLQTFTQAQVMTQGGPNYATMFYVLYLYQRFRALKMGYASALAWILFLIILLLTLVVLRSSSFWVFYESGEKRGT